MVNVTKEAVDEFNKMTQVDKDSEKKMLRISFGGYGWGGPQFRLALDELKNKDDIVEESTGIKVVYTEDIADYLNGTVIDYSNNWFRKGFTISGGSASSC